MKTWIILSCALLWLGAGCQSVQPWERETLSTPRMALDADPDEAAMVQSRRRTREEGHVGAPGSSSSGSGGGCGCN